MYLKKLLLLCYVLISLQVGTYAQSSQGTDFWVAFLQNCDISSTSKDYYTLELTITSKEETDVKIENIQTGFSKDLTVEANGTIRVNIPYEDFNLNKYGVVTNEKSLHVTSTAPISVYVTNAQYHSMESALALPTSACGSYYITQMNKVRVEAGAYKYYPAIFCVIGTEDNTEVEITPTLKTGAGNPANQPFKITLNAGDVYAVETTSSDQGKDFSGSQIRVSDNKKVAVFVGNASSCIPEPTPTGDGDNIMDVAYPVTSWGQNFLVVPLKGGRNDLIKITAADNGADLYRDGTMIANLKPFESYSFMHKESDGAFTLSSSEPVEVYQYMTSVNYEGRRNIGGPSYQYIAPLEQSIEEITFTSFDNIEVNEHYINIIIKAEDEDLVELDGATNFTEFSSLPSASEYKFAIAKVTKGSHTLKAPNGVIANLYGLGESISYAYSAGSSIKSINPAIQGLKGKYKVIYNGNGATKGSMLEHTYSIGLDETTKLDANQFERKADVRFFDNSLNQLYTLESGYTFAGWQHDDLLTEITNNMESNWNYISTNTSGTVYDLITLSTEDNINKIAIKPRESVRERLYSRPIYTPEDDYKLKFKVCSPSGYQDLGDKWEINFKVAVCNQPQEVYCNDEGMLTKGDEKSAVLVDCYNASEEMVSRDLVVYATGTTPLYITINAGNLKDGTPYNFKFSDFEMTSLDGSPIVYSDEEMTKNIIREDGGVVALKAIWEKKFVTLPEPPEKEGYIFNGWNERWDGAGKLYQIGDKVHSEFGSNLYAIWKKIKTCEPTTANIEESICEGEEYISLKGKSYSQPAEFCDTIVNQKGCDSLVYVKLNVLSKKTENVKDTVYNDESYSKYGFSFDHFDELGEFDYTTTSVGENGCDSVFTLTLKVMERPFVIPTAFTPHYEDGLNDHFMRGYEVYIYDRYGNLVCHSENGWDGTYRGKIATPGVYVYTLFMKDGEQKKGTIEVVKSKK